MAPTSLGGRGIGDRGRGRACLGEDQAAHFYSGHSFSNISIACNEPILWINASELRLLVIFDLNSTSFDQLCTVAARNGAI